MLFRRLLTNMARNSPPKAAAASSSAAREPRDRPFTVTVEGNIGSGKTTFLNYFEKLPNITVLAEPVDMWRNCNGHNLLGKMYEDPKKWSFTLQSYIQLTMLQSHVFRPSQSPAIKMMERSIYSARYCFVERMVRDGILEPPSTSVLDEWFKWILANNEVGVDLIIYLRTTPETVYERMLARNREEESKVPLDYLKGLHELHENWLYYKTGFSCPAPVITVDADLDLSVMQSEYGKCEDQILNRSVVSAI